MDIGILVLFILGGSFTFIGGLVGSIFLYVHIGFMVVIPLFFLISGIIMLAAAIKIVVDKKKIIWKGKKYAAKIYSYVEDHSYTENGQYNINAKVHYFDEYGIEKEAVIPTGFARGSREYPIGMTIDIYEYNGKFNFDKTSVRNEVLPREAELMDDKPVDRGQIRLIAVNCANCGSSYEAMIGYTAKCPYCGSYINA